MEGDTSKPWSPASQAELEWYQSQLYEMFGNEADSFLHPKIEQQAKKPVNSKLAKQGGRAGAEKLWDTLRKESIIRLLREDQSIPRDLKDTYSAFVRQSLGGNRKIVRRNFYAEDDVPELGRLMDQSALSRVRTTKHKIDLMYRASTSNKDRTNILTHNNPLPDFARDQDTSTVGRYLPSWTDDGSDESLPEYTKWLTGTTGREVTSRNSDIPAEENDPWKRDTLDDEVILLMTRKRKPAPQPKYVFMTEKDMKTKGQFSEKFKDEAEYRDKPRPFEGTVTSRGQGSQSAIGSGNENLTVGKRADTAPLPQKHYATYDSYTTAWEPLTMHALVEYKKKLETEGEGDFKMGRAPVWKTDVKVT